MGITGKTPKECYQAFREHVAKVMAATLTKETIAIDTQSGQVSIGFAIGQPVALNSRSLGKVYFGFSQALNTVSLSKREHRLRTVGYWYRLQGEPGPKARALIRWEYEHSDPARPKFARHHVQLAAAIDTMDLNRLHIPSGRVPFEEVIRFLIHDLEIEPLARDWARTLAESERTFYATFMTNEDYPHY